MPQHHRLNAETDVFIVSPTNSTVVVSTGTNNTSTTTITSSTTINSSGAAYTPVTDKKLEAAVYAHLQALRALGHSQVNSAEIARALNINHGRVSEIVAGLQAKGVKIAR